LDGWQFEVNNRLLQVKTILDTTYIENHTLDMPDINSNISMCLSPVNGNNLYSGLTKLRTGLIRLKLISEKTTSLVDIRRLFGFRKDKVKIDWIGSIVALRHFVLELENQIKIHKFEKCDKYRTVA
jgi:hypothetical protein